jgi:nitrogen fixation-related uncharacterized protein
MFSKLRDPRGKFTLLAAAIALLALAMFTLPFQGTALAFVPVALLLASLVCGVLWWRGRKADQYDLRRLFDEPPPSKDEPYEDHIPEGEESAPYCGWCDECYPPGTYRCLRCKRELG